MCSARGKSAATSWRGNYITDKIGCENIWLVSAVFAHVGWKFVPNFFSSSAFYFTTVFLFLPFKPWTVTHSCARHECPLQHTPCSLYPAKPAAWTKLSVKGQTPHPPLLTPWTNHIRNPADTGYNLRMKKTCNQTQKWPIFSSFNAA